MSSQSSAAAVKGAGLPRVLLLLDAAGDRRVLTAWLEGRYEVLATTDYDALEADFDLCILDAATYARLWERIGERKSAAEPIFLPFLLIMSEPTNHLVFEIPKHDLDEVLEAPAPRGLVLSRADVLVSRRRHELELNEERERALHELRAAQERADDLIRYAPTGIYEISFRPPRFLSVNDAMSVMSGYSREELLAMNPFDLLDEASQQLFQERIRRTMAGETPSEDVEYRVLTKTGQELIVVLNVRFIRDDTGAPVGAFVIGHDVTERRRAEDALQRSTRRFEILSEANSLLLSSDNPESVIQVIAEMVMEHLEADVFFNYVLDPGAARLRLNAWGGVDQRVAKMIEGLELGQAICGCVARDGERIVSEDVQNNGDSRADLVRRMGVRCYACHPLVAGGRTVGTLSFGTKSKDCFSDDELDLMRTVANQVSIAMERVLAEDASRFQSFLLESVSDSVIVYYPDEPDMGRLVYVNDAACADRGYTHDEMMQLNAIDLIAPQWRSRLQPRLDRLSRGEEVREESEHVRKDGSIFPVEVSLHRVDFGGRPLVVNVSRDITGAKRAQQEVQTELANTQLLQDVAVAAGAALDLKEDLVHIFEAIDRHLGLQAGDVRLLSPDGRYLRLLASVGWPEETQRRVREVPLADSDWMSSRVVTSGRMLTQDDEEPATPEREMLLREAGVLDSRYAALPLAYSGRTLGMMSLSFRGRRSFTVQEKELFNAVARIVSQAVENYRLFEVEREAAALGLAFAKLDRTVHSSLDFAEVATRALSDAAQALGAESGAIHGLVEGGWEVWYDYGFDPSVVGHGFTNDENVHGVLAVQKGEPVAIDDAFTDERVDNEVMKRYGLRSSIVAPLIVRGKAIAALYYNYSAQMHHFTRPEIEFVRNVASSLSLAMENARLYETEREIADRLQEALLALPDEVPGVEFAHAYHSAAEAARVGGDFYDLFQLSHEHVGIVVGDVAGKGVDAAVLTSMVKNTIRAHANERGKTPREILTLTNEVVYRATSTESFVTVFFGILDCRDGRFVYANAGHPTAAVLRLDGSVGGLTVAGPLVGAFKDVDFDEAEACLEVGELLFLYTDGLTEARADGEMYGEERVFDRLSVIRPGRAAEVVREMVEDVVAYTGNRLRDDLAILAVKRLEQGASAPHQQKLEL